MREDDFTSTVDGAAAFERLRGMNDYDPADDLPDLADVVDDAPRRPLPELCKEFRTNPDGSRTYCTRVEHLDRAGNVIGRHEPYPYTVPAEAFAPGGWMAEPPF